MLRCHLSVMSEFYLQGLGHGVHPYKSSIKIFSGEARVIGEGAKSGGAI